MAPINRMSAQTHNALQSLILEVEVAKEETPKAEHVCETEKEAPILTDSKTKEGSVSPQIKGIPRCLIRITEKGP